MRKYQSFHLELLHKRESKFYHPSKVSFELHYIEGTEKTRKKISLFDAKKEMTVVMLWQFIQMNFCDQI